jgi:hypothetical protein
MLAVSAAHVQELGAVIGVLGALVVAFGAFSVLSTGMRRRSPDGARRTEKIAYLLGALLIALAFVVQIVAINMRKTNPANAGAAAIGSISTLAR